MVGLELLIKIQPEKRLEFLQACELVRNSKPEDCIGQTLYEKIEEPNVFLWVEDWNSREKLAAYQQTDHFKSMLGAIEVLGTLKEIKKVTLEQSSDHSLSLFREH